tara:strand:- start:867 stop:1514 length:648 start_codon:yes stop_codon:yes gene_type:complete
MEVGKVEIVFTKLSEIQEADRNVKDHDIGSIHESMNRFGFTSPLLLNEATGKLVAGHGRIEALKQKKQFKESVPANIKVDDESGEWLVPVIRGVSFKNEEEAQAYLLADNRLVELGGWNTSALIEELEKLAEESSLQGTGFDDADIQAMYEDLEKQVGEGSDKGLPVGKPSYEIIFDDETQQAMFFEFVSWLKKNYDGETVGERLYQHIEICLGD